MEKKYCVILGNNFDDIEGITIINILRRSNIHLDIFGVGQERINSFTNMIYHLDRVFNQSGDISTEEYAGILLPGGPGVRDLAQNAELLVVLRKFFDENKLVFGICGAPLVLDRAGILEGRNFTCLPSVIPMIHSGNYLEKNVVVDGHLVTSKALGTSMQAALKLVEVIASKEIAKKTADSYYIEVE